MTQIVEWIEPWYGPGELPVHVTLTCSLEHARNATRNAHPEKVISDEAALEDFLTIHWATIKDIPDALPQLP